MNFDLKLKFCPLKFEFLHNLAETFMTQWTYLILCQAQMLLYKIQEILIKSEATKSSFLKIASSPSRKK